MSGRTKSNWVCGHLRRRGVEKGMEEKSREFTEKDSELCEAVTTERFLQTSICLLSVWHRNLFQFLICQERGLHSQRRCFPRRKRRLKLIKLGPQFSHE